MEIELRIEQFEGPLDLLLHLIKQTKLDILEIKLEEIINQYLLFINNMEKLNLNVASDYLVMASELLEIKSRKILPRYDEEEEIEEEDLEEKLKKRLLEYKIYKELSTDLKEQEEKRKEIFTKPPERVNDYLDQPLSYDNELPMDALVLAFSNFLSRQELSKPLKTKITNKELSITKRKFEIKSILHSKPRVSFFELFDEYSKEYVVITFLTILEMAKEKEIIIEQDENFQEIYCEVFKNE